MRTPFRTSLAACARVLTREVRVLTQKLDLQVQDRSSVEFNEEQFRGSEQMGENRERYETGRAISSRI